MKVVLRTEVVQEHLARRNLTLTELAQLSGMAKGTLSLVMTGNRNPGPSFRRRLMRGMKIKDFDALFTITAEETAG